MDYRYLKAFLLTAENRSFSRAAEALSIAQSAVSRQIKLLEESLGEELIIRSSKKVLLTNKGKELFLAAQHFDKLAVDIFQKEDSRPLNIGILHGLLKNWFAPILVKFFKKGGRNMNIYVQDQPELLKGIENGLFDAIFSTSSVQSELISSLKLFDERLVLISKVEVNRKKLSDYPWIVFSEGDNLFRLSKKRSDSILKVESMDTILNMVKNNVGIAVVPDHVLPKTHSFQVMDVSLNEKSEIFMTTLNYKSMPKPLKELTELVTKDN